MPRFFKVGFIICGPTVVDGTLLARDSCGDPVPQVHRPQKVGTPCGGRFAFLEVELFA